MTTVRRNGRSSFCAASFPGAAGEAGDEGELAFAGDVEGGDAVAVLVHQPGVGEFGPGPGGGLEVELRVALPVLFAGVGVGDDGGGHVALVELDALGVELVVLQFQCCVQGFADLRRPRGWGRASFSRPAATGSRLRWCAKHAFSGA